MWIDVYDFCFGGIGKKVKFCCFMDIVGEWEKIMSLINLD